MAQGETAAAKSGLSFKKEHRLAELPKVIEKLEAEIAKLEGLMSDPALFTTDPDKFQKASAALVARHEMLSDAEAEWMELEELNSYRKSLRWCSGQTIPSILLNLGSR